MTTRVAIVTGSSQGIGHAIALRLADDGLDVAVNDIDRQKSRLDTVVKEIQERGRRSIGVCADVSTEEGVRALVDTVVRELGGVDVMVANAGVVVYANLLDTSTEDFDRIMRVNARGPFLQYKIAAEQMIKQGRGGRIIGASSMCGHKGFKTVGAYVASKFAVRGLTATAAAEWVKHGITVNAYAPGIINTELAKTEADAGRGTAVAMKIAFGLPVDGPLGETEDVAGLVSYLAKPESRFITGQTLLIDGGTLLL
ncbi:hypothetical protein PLICRDRAFT_51515 [Plicaturopsis crispa FD-325 SS-3]|nr:hypothetical protein PLICRDRAFT_51515 [Plicaturopsis crispa FD-325 SS-3]